MTPTKPEDTVAALEAQLARLKDDMTTKRTRLLAAEQKRAKDIKLRLRRARYQVAARERKKETRRNTLAGAWVRAEGEQNEKVRKWLIEGLDGSLTRPQDRELFDLAPLLEDDE